MHCALPTQQGTGAGAGVLLHGTLAHDEPGPKKMPPLLVQVVSSMNWHVSPAGDVKQQAPETNGSLPSGQPPVVGLQPVLSPW